MKIASDENSVIKELQEEAEKRKKTNTQLNEAGISDDNNWLSKSSSVLNKNDVGSSVPSNAIDLSDVGNSDLASREDLSRLLSSFLSNLSSSNNNKLYTENALLNSTLSKFLIDSSKKKYGTKTRSDSILPSDDALGNYLDTTKSSSLGNGNGSNQTFGDIDISKLIADNLGDKAIDVDAFKKLIESLMYHNTNGSNLDIYNLLLKSLKDTNSHRLRGLDSFLAMSAVLDRTKLEKIDVDFEIFRTNFVIKNDIDIIEPMLPYEDYYLDNSLNSLPKVVALNKVINLIKKVPSLKTIDHTSTKEYHLPNWFYKKDRDSLDMKVKQLNRLYSKRSKKSLAGDVPNTNDVTDSLNSLLMFESSSEEDGKEGFSQAGMTLDELSSLRRTFTDKSGKNVDKSYYSTISNSRLMKFDSHGLVTYSNGIWNSPLILPRLMLGNVIISSNQLSHRKGGNYNPENAREKFYHRVYNTSVEALLRRAPDFRQNMYMGMFVFTKSDGETLKDFQVITNSIDGYTDDKTISLKRTGVDNTVLTQLNDAYNNVLKTYFVRMQGIEIPSAAGESYEVKFLNRTLKKTSNLFNENHKITIEFVVDEMGLIVRNFNLLTGQFGHQYNETGHNNYASTLFPVEFSTKNTGRLDLVVTYNDFRINKNYLEGDTMTSAYFPAQQNVETETDSVESRNGKQVWGSPRAYRQFILEDVKILGISSGDLKFSRDSSGRMTVSVDLIFRRISTVDNNSYN